MPPEREGRGELTVFFTPGALILPLISPHSQNTVGSRFKSGRKNRNLSPSLHVDALYFGELLRSSSHALGTWFPRLPHGHGNERKLPVAERWESPRSVHVLYNLWNCGPCHGHIRGCLAHACICGAEWSNRRCQQRRRGISGDPKATILCLHLTAEVLKGRCI